MLCEHYERMTISQVVLKYGNILLLQENNFKCPIKSEEFQVCKKTHKALF